MTYRKFMRMISRKQPLGNMKEGALSVGIQNCDEGNL